MDSTHKVGISSFAYNFAVGYRGNFKPDKVMTPIDLINKAACFGVPVVQISDNMPLEIIDDDHLDEIRVYAEEWAREGVRILSVLSQNSRNP